MYVVGTYYVNIVSNLPVYIYTHVQILNMSTA